MVIGVDASRANRADRTGTEWYSFELVKAWAANPPAGVTFELYLEDAPRGELAALPPVFRPRLLRWPPRFLWTQLRLSAAFVRRQPDVLFIPAHTMPIAHPRKTVVTVHDLGFERFPELYRKEPIGPRSAAARLALNLAARVASVGRYSSTELDYQRWSVRYAVRHATRIIAVSSFTRDDLVRTLACPPDKISVIPNGIDHHRYRPIDDEGRIERTLNRYSIRRPYFLTIGRLEKKKNTLRTVEAFAWFRAAKPDHARYSLILAGRPGYGAERVEEAIRRLKLTDAVQRPGWVPEDDVPSLLSAASAFVFPSLYEGFGIPVVEAMACGTPVIAADRAALPEVAGDAALLIDPLEVNAIAKAMGKVADDSTLRQSLRERGLEQARAYSWTRTAKETLKLLLELAHIEKSPA